jgi:CBS domain-containing protein
MDVSTASEFMRDREVRRLPIVDREDRLVGLVALDDLVQFLGRELHNLTEGIRSEMEVR